MSYILFNDISVEEEDLIREAAKLMGYARVGTGVSTLFKTALKLGCKNGRLIKEDIRWKLTEEGNIFAKNLGSNVVCEEIVSEELNDELDDIDTTTSNGTSGQGLYIVKKLLLMMNCTNPIIEIHDHNFMITIDFSPLLIKK